MTNDNNIDCSVIDATYIGNGIEEYAKNNQYRLRAVRSKGGSIKIRTDEASSQIHIYGNDAHFESSWVNVKRVAIKKWE